MFIPIPMQIRSPYSSGAPPIANSILIGLNVLIWVFIDPMRWWVGPGTGPLSILTYGFVHAGAGHLLFNMWALWVFGNPVNRRIGNANYLLIYLGTIVALGFLARILSGGYLLGSSGAVFAVIAVAAVLMPSTRVEIHYIALFPITLLIGLFRAPAHALFWFIRWGSEDIPALVLFVAVPLLELCGFLWWGLNWSNLGHLLGFVCGVAGVLLLPARITMPRRQRIF